MKVKEESEKVGLKLHIQKTKIMASGPITSWKVDGETMETVSDFILGGSKIPEGGAWSHEIKRLTPWCWERLKMRGEGDNRGWNGWVASPSRWTWDWVSSESVMDSEACRGAVHGVTMRLTPLSDWTEVESRWEPGSFKEASLCFDGCFCFNASVFWHSVLVNYFEMLVFCGLRITCHLKTWV